MQETQEAQVQSLGQDDPLEKGMATHSRILAWRTPWTEESGRLQSTRSQKAGHDWSDWACTHACNQRHPRCLIANSNTNNSSIFTNLLGDLHNYTPANSLNTPLCIKPEWYFLFAYAILQPIPNKLVVLALIFSALILAFIPMFHTSKQWSIMFRPLSQYIFWVLVADL